MNPKNINAVIAASFLFSLVLLAPGYTYAEDNSKMQDLKDERKERVGERKENRCEIVTERVDKRITTFEEHKDKHIAQYQKLTDKVKEMVKRLKEKGYDTTKLEEDLKILDAKNKQVAADYEEFIQKLKAARELACGNSQGQFVEAMKTAREQLKKVHEEVKEIRTYFKEVIKEDIKDLRDQKKESSEPEE